MCPIRTAPFSQKRQERPRPATPPLRRTVPAGGAGPKARRAPQACPPLQGLRHEHLLYSLIKSAPLAFKPWVQVRRTATTALLHPPCGCCFHFAQSVLNESRPDKYLPQQTLLLCITLYLAHLSAQTLEGNQSVSTQHGRSESATEFISHAAACPAPKHASRCEGKQHVQSHVF